MTLATELIHSQDEFHHWCKKRGINEKGLAAQEIPTEYPSRVFQLSSGAIAVIQRKHLGKIIPLCLFNPPLEQRVLFKWADTGEWAIGIMWEEGQVRIDPNTVPLVNFSAWAELPD